jgi:hypothetical protein
MKSLFLVLILTLSGIVGFSVQSSAEDSWTGNINLLAGCKALDKNDWEPTERQKESGVSVDFRKLSSSVAIVLGFIESGTEHTETFSYNGYVFDSKMKSSTKEMRLGIKWEPTTTIRPYLALGLAMIGAEAKITLSNDSLGTTSVKVDDQHVGAWLGGGLYWVIANHLNLGIDLAYSMAKVTLFNQKLEAGGAHAALMVGYHW